ncbi:MAG: LLM class F420-dependent oxidoreductase, partial [Alphaproteobacteria bacterium]
MVEVGVFITFNGATPPEQNIALAQAAEERGFAALWVPEHVLFFEQYASRYPYSEDGKITGLNLKAGIMDPFIALTWLAAHTKRIRLGTAVALIPQREPIYTAKVVADLDYLSGGRVNLGIGVGWLKEEFDALGIPFADRGKRARECIKVMQTLWCDEVSQHKGELFNLPPSLQNPKPVQKPHPPMFFGGESEPALKRVADIGQGWLGASMMPEEMPAKLKRLDEL